MSIETRNDDEEKSEKEADTKPNNSLRRHSLCLKNDTDKKIDNAILGNLTTNSEYDSNRRSSFSVFQDIKLNSNNNLDSERQRSQHKLRDFIENNVDKQLQYKFDASSRRGSRIFLPPLAKSDSFYDGSVQNVVEIKSSCQIKKDSTDGDLDLNKNFARRQSTVNLSKLDIESRNKKCMKKTLKISNLIDTWFWFNPSLMLLLLSRFLGHFSMVLFFMFLPTLLLEFGYSLEKASLMLTVIGISNTVFRIVVGALMDHPRISPAMLTTVGFILQAILQCLLPF